MGAQVRHYLLPKNRGIVCATPRAGSVSMAEALAPMHHGTGAGSVLIQEEKVLHLRPHMPCYMWIRHPADRIMSAWSIWKMRKEINVPEDFARLVLGTSNIHWNPQVEVHTSKSGFFLPTVIYAFEDLNQTFPEVTGKPIEHLNETEHNRLEPWSWFRECLDEKLKLQMTDKFEEDLKLWSDVHMMRGEGMKVA